jgi:hypothetical protein
MFTTKIKFSDEKVFQESGNTITLSGETRLIDGQVVGYGEIDDTGDGADYSTLKGINIVNKKYVDDKVEEISSESLIYNGASPSTIALGGLPVNSVLTGRTANEILEEMLVVYLAPAFSAFSVTGQATTVESGTELTGSRTFTWSTTNSGNVQANSIAIRDVTASTLIASGLANDGSESVSITTTTLTNAAQTQAWRVEGQNTQSGSFNSSNFTVTARYFRFFGPSASEPTDSASVRALPTSGFQTANGNTFILNTGNVLTDFYVALPPSRTIASVFDLDALNANITSQYILIGTVSVLDGGGTGTSRTYNLYRMTVGAPYDSNHRHEITTA